MIGHRMWATLGAQHETIGVLRRSELGALESIPGISQKNSLLGVEITDIPAAILKTKPDIVLNCIGIVKQHKDSNNYSKSISVNALLPHQIANACAEIGCRMIQFSSDCVFDGLKGNYTESDFADAQDLYGRSKALGEVGYMENVLTIRTSTIGREVFPHGGLIEWFLANKGQEIKGYTKAIYSGFPTKRLANIINDYVIPSTSLSGIVHIASQPIDKFSLLNMIKDHFKLPIDILADNKVTIERSLNSNAFNKLTGFQSPSWKEMMKDLEVDQNIYENIRNQNV